MWWTAQRRGGSRAAAYLSVEAGQEFLFHRLRREAREAAFRKFDNIDAPAVWHPLNEEVLRAARRLVTGSGIRGRDAVHAETVLSAGFSEVISTDPDFDAIPDLRRIDPSDWVA